MTTANPTQPPWKAHLTPTTALLGVSVLLLIVLFWDALGNLWTRWGEQQELSHSYFIPVISGWLVWTNRKAVMSSIGDPSIYGFAILAAGLAMLVLGQLSFVFVLQHIGLVFVIAGLIAGFGGMSLLRITAAPVAFLFFAVPPPYWVVTVLSWKFQFMSSVIGVWMIELMGIPVFLSGNIIDLGEYKLQVAEACSGLRYLFPFVSLGVITAYMFRGPLWQKAIIVIATIPITIFMNSVRIALTGALVQAFGNEHAEGALHFFEGWVVFVLCLALLFAVIMAMTKIFKNPHQGLDSLVNPVLKPVAPSVSKIKLLYGALAGAGLSLGAIFLSSVTSPDSLIIPERTIFAGIPSEFPEWSHTVRPIDPEVAETLGADDSLVVNFTTEDENTFNLYVAYLEAQRDGRSWHSPRQCIPGGGWEITSHEIIETKSAGGDDIAFNRLVIRFQDYEQLVYYWYDQRGRTVANEFIMKFWLLFDAVTKRRSDGALVRIMTSVNKTESIEAADQRLSSMMSRLDPVLPRYIPE